MLDYRSASISEMLPLPLIHSIRYKVKFTSSASRKAIPAAKLHGIAMRNAMLDVFSIRIF